MLDRMLLNPTVNRTFAMLDDSTSMASIATRDLVDSSGRTYMEYQRSPHGGRERLVEELLTWGIWGFGIRTMKTMYDRAMTEAPLFKKWNVQQPDLDISLLPGQHTEPGEQKLSRPLVEKFARRFETNGEKGPYHHLLDILENSPKGRSLQNLYRHSSIAKFFLATGMPVITIAFGIPTLNQWWTRQKLAMERLQKEGRPKEPPPAAVVPVDTTRASLEPGVLRGHSLSWQAGHPRAAQTAITASAPNRPVAAMNAWRKLGGRFPAWPANQPSSVAEGALPVMPPGSPLVGRRESGPQFGGLGDIASSLLQNERYNTLLVDGTLSGGRIVKARNWRERAEIAFREGVLIFFLYYAQGFLQNNLIGRALEKSFKIPTRLDFTALKHLHDQVSSRHFPHEYQKGLKTLAADMSRHLHGKQAAGIETMLFRREGHRDAALVATIQDYFLNGKPGSNLILDTAQATGWIPTFKNAAGKTCLDLSKKIQTDSIFNLVEVLGNVAEKVHLQPEGFQPLMRKAMAGRASAWFLANGVCAFVLSYLAPKLQHYITYLQTGKDYFPGVEATENIG